MPSGFVHHKKSALHFTTIGTGPRNLLLFHGFGQDNNIYYSLAENLSSHFTIYVFDLYFHGKSDWGYGELALEKDHWKETILKFLEENGIQDFSVAGFSLGGKFALATVEAMPDRVHEIFLLAPDGIKTSFWYSMATYPLLLRKLFKSMIHHPEHFLSISKVLHKMGLVDKSLIKFAVYQMNSEEKRNRVYYSWVVFRHLRFDLSKLARIINHHKIFVTIVVGQYDRVIKATAMQRFVKKLDRCRFETPEAGHSGLISVSVKYFHKNAQR